MVTIAKHVASVLVYLLVTLQLGLLCSQKAASAVTRAIAATSDAPVALEKADFDKRAVVDVNIVTPAFLIQMPFSVGTGPSLVSGTILIYYQATRSVKAVGGPGQFYTARISITTFLFVFEYQSSVVLPGHSNLHYSKDTLYLQQVEAEIQAVDVSFGTGLAVV
ncbi:hypothetical protein LPJ66_000452 [Kickxella alabastrina]|uniref:Uncharacterized protein n=1 Tax=Kickxella alabastrina TaxID=61397 RepID=A0ACC1IW07_9FUNG|nr:hypothetical protein LPJ66_000452 [Kickxella alabastrina]